MAPRQPAHAPPSEKRRCAAAGGAEPELLRMPGIGAKLLAQIREALEAHDASHARVEACAFALGLGLNRAQA